MAALLQQQFHPALSAPQQPEVGGAVAHPVPVSGAPLHGLPGGKSVFIHNVQQFHKVHTSQACFCKRQKAGKI